MKGLALSELYFEAYGRPLLEQKYGRYLHRIAAGLVGHGSECLGFDDAFSQDHDFGPGFCLWLLKEDYDEIGEVLRHDYETLTESFLGFSGRKGTPQGAGRVGVFEIGAFYRGITGYEEPPKKLVQWLYLPEEVLSSAVNGKVFVDEAGVFSQIREGFLHYPNDVRLKKLAVRLGMMAQAGQYNFGRAGRRGDMGAMYFSMAEFCKAAVSAVYLLNDRYAPFYKWQLAGMDSLPVLRDVRPMLEYLMGAPIPGTAGTAASELERRIEEICVLFMEELNRQGLSSSWEPFLETQKQEVLLRIADSGIRNL